MCNVCLQTGHAFAAAADMYVRRFLQKGIPSLFTDLKSLYSNPAKAEVCFTLHGLLSYRICIVSAPQGRTEAPRLLACIQRLHSRPNTGCIHRANIVQALGALLQRLLDAVTADGAFPPRPGQSDPEPATDQALLWTMAWAAQHHDRMGDTGTVGLRAGTLALRS